MANLAGKVCLVTGASRGIGRGIALQLGEAGATVYITGRSAAALGACADEIKARGGTPVQVQMDHGKDADVEALFQRIKDEQKGRLDVLVNNAYAGVGTIMDSMGKPFWETATPETWDTINGVGLRGHYHCTTLAARLMVARGSGLIVIVSSPGGIRYLFNVAYGVGKAACDRMAADCGFELRKKNVAVVSLWPGPVKTEMVKEKVLDSTADNPDAPKQSVDMFEKGESVEFSGMAVANLAADANVMRKSGRVVLTADLAYEYGFKDLDGTVPDSLSVKTMLQTRGWLFTAAHIPSFVRVPKFVLHMMGYKF